MAARCHMLVWYINGFHINLLVDKQTEKYKQFNLIAERHRKYIGRNLSLKPNTKLALGLKLGPNHQGAFSTRKSEFRHF